MKDDLAIFRKLYRRTLGAVLGNFQRHFEKLRDVFKSFAADRRYESSAFALETGCRTLWELKKDYGAYGEYLLYDALRREKGRWLFGVYLPHKGEFTEIDALFFSERGVFIFESKNISGRIYGLENQREWVHTYPTAKGIRKRRFFNPMMQNGAHRRELERLLPSGTPLYAMVVFGKKSELCTELVRTRSKELLTVGKLKKTVRSFPKGALRLDEREKLYALLQPYAHVSQKVKDDHVAAVKKGNA